MQINTHFLFDDQGVQVPFVATPNKGGQFTPKYLIMHYTAGSNADAAVNWLTQPRARASAHLVIGRDGKITQLAPFNVVTWHAGRSSWNGLSHLNNHTIGIELDNAGAMDQRGDRWYPWFGRPYTSEEVLVAQHKHESFSRGWHTFTEAQLQAALEVAIAIFDEYDTLKDVLGHDDISPGRKVDPGPAFPMVSFRSKVLGRLQDEVQEYQTIAPLNIRIGPGIQFDKLSISPLPKDTKVTILNHNGNWKYVDVLDDVNNEGHGFNGWVHGGYLKEV